MGNGNDNFEETKGQDTAALENSVDNSGQETSAPKETNEEFRSSSSNVGREISDSERQTNSLRDVSGKLAAEAQNEFRRVIETADKRTETGHSTVKDLPAKALTESALEIKAKELNAYLKTGIFKSANAKFVQDLIGTLDEKSRTELAKQYQKIFSTDASIQENKLKLDIEKAFGKNSPENIFIQGLITEKSGQTSHASILMTALAYVRRGNSAWLSGKEDIARGESMLRQVIGLRSEAELVKLEQDLKKEFPNEFPKNKSLLDSLQNVTGISDATKFALKAYLNPQMHVKDERGNAKIGQARGIENRNPQILADLAEMAVRKGDIRLLDESLRSYQNKSAKGEDNLGTLARQEFNRRLQNNPELKSLLAKSFSAGDKLIAQDIVERGSISLKTIAESDIGKVFGSIRNNFDDLKEQFTRAYGTQEGKDFTQGQKWQTKIETGQITESKLAPAQRKELEEYRKIHQVLVKSLRGSEVAQLEDLLVNGKATLISEIAKANRANLGEDTLFGLGLGRHGLPTGGHTAKELMDPALKISQAEIIERLSEKNKADDFLLQLNSALSLFADKGEAKRILDMLSEKAKIAQAAKSMDKTPEEIFQATQKIGFSVFDALPANKNESWFSWERLAGKQYNAEGVLKGLSQISASDIARYKRGDKVSIDTAINALSQEWQKKMASDLLSRALQMGKTPELNLTEKIMLASISGDTLAEKVKGMEDIFKQTYAKGNSEEIRLLKTILGPKDKLSNDQKLVRSAVEDVLWKATGTGSAVKYLLGFSENRYDRAIKSLAETGSINIDSKLSFNYAHKDVYQDLLKASTSEFDGQKATSGLLSKEEIKLLENVRKENRKELTLAEEIALFQIGESGWKYSDFKEKLQQLDPSKRQLLKDEYATKTGRSLESDFLALVPAKEQMNYKLLLSSQAKTDVERDYFEQMKAGFDKQSDWSVLRPWSLVHPLTNTLGIGDATNMSLAASMSTYGAVLQDYKRMKQELPPEIREHMNNALGGAISELEKSQHYTIDFIKESAHTAMSLGLMIGGTMLAGLLAPETGGGSIAAWSAYISAMFAVNAAVGAGQNIATEMFSRGFWRGLDHAMIHSEEPLKEATIMGLIGVGTMGLVKSQVAHGRMKVLFGDYTNSAEKIIASALPSIESRIAAQEARSALRGSFNKYGKIDETKFAESLAKIEEVAGSQVSQLIQSETKIMLEKQAIIQSGYVKTAIANRIETDTAKEFIKTNGLSLAAAKEISSLLPGLIKTGGKIEEANFKQIIQVAAKHGLSEEQVKAAIIKAQSGYRASGLQKIDEFMHSWVYPYANNFATGAIISVGQEYALLPEGGHLEWDQILTGALKGGIIGHWVGAYGIPVALRTVQQGRLAIHNFQIKNDGYYVSHPDGPILIQSADGTRTTVKELSDGRFEKLIERPGKSAQKTVEDSAYKWKEGDITVSAPHMIADPTFVPSERMRQAQSLVETLAQGKLAEAEKAELQVLLSQVNKGQTLSELAGSGMRVQARSGKVTYDYGPVQKDGTREIIYTVENKNSGKTNYALETDKRGNLRFKQFTEQAGETFVIYSSNAAQSAQLQRILPNILANKSLEKFIVDIKLTNSQSVSLGSNFAQASSNLAYGHFKPEIELVLKPNMSVSDKQAFYQILDGLLLKSGISAQNAQGKNLTQTPAEIIQNAEIVKDQKKKSSHLIGYHENVFESVILPAPEARVGSVENISENISPGISPSISNVSNQAILVNPRAEAAIKRNLEILEKTATIPLKPQQIIAHIESASGLKPGSLVYTKDAKWALRVDNGQFAPLTNKPGFVQISMGNFMPNHKANSAGARDTAGLEALYALRALENLQIDPKTRFADLAKEAVSPAKETSADVTSMQLVLNPRVEQQEITAAQGNKLANGFSRVEIAVQKTDKQLTTLSVDIKGKQLILNSSGPILPNSVFIIQNLGTRDSKVIVPHIEDSKSQHYLTKNSVVLVRVPVSAQHPQGFAAFQANIPTLSASPVVSSAQNVTNQASLKLLDPKQASVAISLLQGANNTGPGTSIASLSTQHKSSTGNSSTTSLASSQEPKPKEKRAMPRVSRTSDRIDDSAHFSTKDSSTDSSNTSKFKYGDMLRFKEVDKAKESLFERSPAGDWLAGVGHVLSNPILSTKFDKAILDLAKTWEGQKIPETREEIQARMDQIKEVLNQFARETGQPEINNISILSSGLDNFGAYFGNKNSIELAPSFVISQPVINLLRLVKHEYAHAAQHFEMALRIKQELKELNVESFNAAAEQLLGYKFDNSFVEKVLQSEQQLSKVQQDRAEIFIRSYQERLTLNAARRNIENVLSVFGENRSRLNQVINSILASKQIQEVIFAEKASEVVEAFVKERGQNQEAALNYLYRALLERQTELRKQALEQAWHSSFEKDARAIEFSTFDTSQTVTAIRQDMIGLAQSISTGEFTRKYTSLEEAKLAFENEKRDLFLGLRKYAESLGHAEEFLKQLPEIRQLDEISSLFVQRADVIAKNLKPTFENIKWQPIKISEKSPEQLRQSQDVQQANSSHISTESLAKVALTHKAETLTYADYLAQVKEINKNPEIAKKLAEIYHRAGDIYTVAENATMPDISSLKVRRKEILAEMINVLESNNITHPELIKEVLDSIFAQQESYYPHAEKPGYKTQIDGENISLVASNKKLLFENDTLSPETLVELNKERVPVLSFVVARTNDSQPRFKQENNKIVDSKTGQVIAELALAGDQINMRMLSSNNAHNYFDGQTIVIEGERYQLTRLSNSDAQKLVDKGQYHVTEARYRVKIGEPGDGSIFNDHLISSNFDKTIRQVYAHPDWQNLSNIQRLEALESAINRFGRRYDIPEIKLGLLRGGGTHSNEGQASILSNKFLITERLLEHFSESSLSILRHEYIHKEQELLLLRHIAELVSQDKSKGLLSIYSKGLEHIVPRQINDFVDALLTLRKYDKVVSVEGFRQFLGEFIERNKLLLELNKFPLPDNKAARKELATEIKSAETNKPTEIFTSDPPASKLSPLNGIREVLEMVQFLRNFTQNSGVPIGQEYRLQKLVEALQTRSKIEGAELQVYLSKILKQNEASDRKISSVEMLRELARSREAAKAFFGENYISEIRKLFELAKSGQEENVWKELSEIAQRRRTELSTTYKELFEEQESFGLERPANAGRNISKLTESILKPNLSSEVIEMPVILPGGRLADLRPGQEFIIARDASLLSQQGYASVRMEPDGTITVTNRAGRIAYESANIGALKINETEPIWIKRDGKDSFERVLSGDSQVLRQGDRLFVGAINEGQLPLEIMSLSGSDTAGSLLSNYLKHMSSNSQATATKTIKEGEFNYPKDESQAHSGSARNNAGSKTVSSVEIDNKAASLRRADRLRAEEIIAEGALRDEILAKYKDLELISEIPKNAHKIDLQELGSQMQQNILAMVQLLQTKGIVHPQLIAESLNKIILSQNNSSGANNPALQFQFQDKVLRLVEQNKAAEGSSSWWGRTRDLFRQKSEESKEHVGASEGHIGTQFLKIDQAYGHTELLELGQSAIIARDRSISGEPGYAIAKFLPSGQVQVRVSELPKQILSREKIEKDQSNSEAREKLYVKKQGIGDLIEIKPGESRILDGQDSLIIGFSDKPKSLDHILTVPKDGTLFRPVSEAEANTWRMLEINGFREVEHTSVPEFSAANPAVHKLKVYETQDGRHLAYANGPWSDRLVSGANSPGPGPRIVRASSIKLKTAEGADFPTTVYTSWSPPGLGAGTTAYVKNSQDTRWAGQTVRPLELKSDGFTYFADGERFHGSGDHLNRSWLLKTDTSSGHDQTNLRQKQAQLLDEYRITPPPFESDHSAKLRILEKEPGLEYEVSTTNLHTLRGQGESFYKGMTFDEFWVDNLSFKDIPVRIYRILSAKQVEEIADVRDSLRLAKLKLEELVSNVEQEIKITPHEVESARAHYETVKREYDTFYESIKERTTQIIVPEDYAKILDVVRSTRQKASLANIDTSDPISSYISQQIVNEAQRAYMSLKLSKYGDRILPEHLGQYIDELVNPGLIRQVTLLPDRDNFAVYESRTSRETVHYAATATLGRKDAGMRVYDSGGNFSNHFGMTIHHEWGHIAEDKKLFYPYSLALKLEKEPFKARKYAEKNDHESFTIDMTEIFLAYSPAYLFTLIEKAPLRAQIIAHNMEKLVGEVAETNSDKSIKVQESTLLEAITKRIDLVKQEENLRQAQQEFMQHLSSESPETLATLFSLVKELSSNNNSVSLLESLVDRVATVDILANTLKNAEKHTEKDNAKDILSTYLRLITLKQIDSTEFSRFDTENIIQRIEDKLVASLEKYFDKSAEKVLQESQVKAPDKPEELLAIVRTLSQVGQVRLFDQISGSLDALKNIVLSEHTSSKDQVAAFELLKERINSKEDLKDLAKKLLLKSAESSEHAIEVFLSDRQILNAIELSDFIINHSDKIALSDTAINKILEDINRSIFRSQGNYINAAESLRAITLFESLRLLPKTEALNSDRFNRFENHIQKIIENYRDWWLREVSSGQLKKEEAAIQSLDSLMVRGSKTVQEISSRLNLSADLERVARERNKIAPDALYIRMNLYTDPIQAVDDNRSFLRRTFSKETEPLPEASRILNSYVSKNDSFLEMYRSLSTIVDKLYKENKLHMKSFLETLESNMLTARAYSRLIGVRSSQAGNQRDNTVAKFLFVEQLIQKYPEIVQLNPSLNKKYTELRRVLMSELIDGHVSEILSRRDDYLGSLAHAYRLYTNKKWALEEVYMLAMNKLRKSSQSNIDEYLLTNLKTLLETNYTAEKINTNKEQAELAAHRLMMLRALSLSRLNLNISIDPNFVSTFHAHGEQLNKLASLDNIQAAFLEIAKSKSIFGAHAIAQLLEAPGKRFWSESLDLAKKLVEQTEDQLKMSKEQAKIDQYNDLYKVELRKAHQSYQVILDGLLKIIESENSALKASFESAISNSEIRQKISDILSRVSINLQEISTKGSYDKLSSRVDSALQKLKLEVTRDAAVEQGSFGSNSAYSRIKQNIDEASAERKKQESFSLSVSRKASNSGGEIVKYKANISEGLSGQNRPSVLEVEYPSGNLANSGATTSADKEPLKILHQVENNRATNAIFSYEKISYEELFDPSLKGQGTPAVWVMKDSSNNILQALSSKAKMENGAIVFTDRVSIGGINLAHRLPEIGSYVGANKNIGEGIVDEIRVWPNGNARVQYARTNSGEGKGYIYYDHLGRIEQLIDPLGGVVSIKYDGENKQANEIVINGSSYKYNASSNAWFSDKFSPENIRKLGIARTMKVSESGIEIRPLDPSSGQVPQGAGSYRLNSFDSRVYQELFRRLDGSVEFRETADGYDKTQLDKVAVHEKPNFEQALSERRILSSVQKESGGLSEMGVSFTEPGRKLYPVLDIAQRESVRAFREFDEQGRTLNINRSDGSRLKILERSVSSQIDKLEIRSSSDGEAVVYVRQPDTNVFINESGTKQLNILDYGKDGLAQKPVAKYVNEITVSPDGSVTFWHISQSGQGHFGERTTLGGQKLRVDQFGHENMLAPIEKDFVHLEPARRDVAVQRVLAKEQESLLTRLRSWSQELFKESGRSERFINDLLMPFIAQSGVYRQEFIEQSRKIDDATAAVSNNANLGGHKNNAPNLTLSQHEINLTLYHMDRILTAIDSTIPLKDRLLLVEQMLHSFNDPRSIDQGPWSVCNVAVGVQLPGAVNHPHELAKLLADLVIDGVYVDKKGGVLDARIIQGLLAKHKTSELPDYTYTTDKDKKFADLDDTTKGRRNYFDQLIQTALINIYWQNAREHPETRQDTLIPATNLQRVQNRARLSSEIVASPHSASWQNYHQPALMRYEIGTGSKRDRLELLRDHSNPNNAEHPRPISISSNARGVDILSDVEMIIRRQKERIQGPLLTDEKLAEIRERVFGGNLATNLLEHASTPHQSPGIASVTDKSELIRRLEELQKIGKAYPVTVAVDSHRLTGADVHSSHFNPNHLVNIHRMWWEPISKDGNPPQLTAFVDVTTAWGKPYRFPKMALDELWYLMAQDANVPIERSRSSRPPGSDETEAAILHIEKDEK